MLGRGVAKALPASAAEVWEPELRALVRRCDLVVCNLECCISERGRPTELVAGKPFFFRGPPSALEALTAISVDAAGLANNPAPTSGPKP